MSQDYATLLKRTETTTTTTVTTTKKLWLNEIAHAFSRMSSPSTQRWLLLSWADLEQTATETSDSRVVRQRSFVLLGKICVYLLGRRCSCPSDRALTSLTQKLTPLETGEKFWYKDGCWSCRFPAMQQKLRLLHNRLFTRDPVHWFANFCGCGYNLIYFCSQGTQTRKWR